MKKTILLTLALFCQLLSAQNIIYVNHAATGANDGSSWTDAYVDLQSALDNPAAGDDIWVAQGTYYPTWGGGNDPRRVFFPMRDSVGVYGGFVGNETMITQRNWDQNKTILSGDVGVKGFAGDNTIRVLLGVHILTPGYSILDGFTISDACDTTTMYGYKLHVGGGVQVLNGSPFVLKNVHITNNIGHGVRCEPGGNVTLINCRIDGNDLLDEEYGRAMYIVQGTVKAYNCVFGPNFPSVPHPRITIDRSEILAKSSNVTISGSTIIDGRNDCSVYADKGANLYLSNTIISDSIVSNTSAQNLPEIYMRGCLARNSGAGSGQFYNPSIIDQGGNIDTVPLFKLPGSYELSYLSPAINAGIDSLVPLDEWDMDYDGIANEPFPYDYTGEPRWVDGRIDIGAHEYISAWVDTTFQTICNGDSTSFGSMHYAKTGVYKQSYAPDSAHYLNLTVDAPNTDVQVWFGGILEAKADSVSYRWINCNNLSINYGATQKIFYPPEQGNYAVIITDSEGCVDTSACFHVSNIGLMELSGFEGISVYPNPTSGVLWIKPFTQNRSGSLQAEVLDISGKVLLQKSIDTKVESDISLNVDHLSKGIYFLKMDGTVLRFVKE